MSEPGYYRFPSIHGQQVVFVCEDDLWTLPAEGGVARRLTANPGRALAPALSPDGSWLAFIGHDEGMPEVYVMPAEGGPSRRLTFMGAQSRDTAWTPEGRIVFASNAGQPFAGQYALYSVHPEGGAPERLPTGPAVSLSFGPDGGQVIGRNTSDIARWKRYRGGMTGDLWVDAEGDGRWRRLIELPGNLARPIWLGPRIYFVSDHEGIGNLYSCTPAGQDLRRHTHHKDFYLRHPASDGRRIVYHAGADLYLFDPESGESRAIDVRLHSPRSQRKRRFVPADAYLQGYDPHPLGHRLAVTSRGKPFSFGNWEGAVRQHGARQGVHHRLAAWLPCGQRLVMVSDAAGEEVLELHEADRPAEAPRRLEDLDIGRAEELLPAPSGELVAISNHRHELLLVDLASGQMRQLDQSPYERIHSLAWSPDARWLAYSHHGSAQTSCIRLCRIEDGERFDATRPVLQDWSPSFDPEGRYLYLLSNRDFDPVYDNLHFDLGFPFGVRPHLITLREDLPSPFQPAPRPLSGDGDRTGGDGDGNEDYEDEDYDEDDAGDADIEADDGDASDEASAGEGGAEPSGEEGDGSEASEEIPPLEIDLEGITDRLLAFPVPEGQYGQIRGIEGKVLYTHTGLESTIHREEDAGQGTLCAFDLESLEESTLTDGVDDFSISMDGKTLVYRSGGALRVVKAGEKPGKDGGASRKSGWIDLGRLRLSLEPAAEWAQMYREAWRLQRDQFWTEDMSGVDWQRIYRRYRPLIDRVATRAEFSDLMWEMQGELGTSHAYEVGGDYRPEPRYAQGFLGADLVWDPEAEGYRVERILRGDPWDSSASSPLIRPGARLRPGDVIQAIDGQPLSAELSPGELLVHRAGSEVELLVAPRIEPDDGARPNEESEVDRATPEAAEMPPDVDGEDRGGDEAREEAPASTETEATAEPPESWTITVRTLSGEQPARYREWVEANRAAVHQASEGRLGYLHIPDMGARGYAEFHRGFLSELVREGLIVDVRFNGGGHVSPLILEKLARRRLGYDVQRWGEPVPYPSESVWGPIVALTNEVAGSDGDMFSHAFKLLGLGPLIGKRTWGGVVGIHPRHRFVDGGYTTQPEYSMWFRDVGFGLENRGTDPDIEVEIRPQDHEAGRDPQLERAIAEALRLLEASPPERPSFEPRPRLDLPELPED